MEGDGYCDAIRRRHVAMPEGIRPVKRYEDGPVYVLMAALCTISGLCVDENCIKKIAQFLAQSDSQFRGSIQIVRRELEACGAMKKSDPEISKAEVKKAVFGCFDAP